MPGNPSSEDLTFKNFPGEDAPDRGPVFGGPYLKPHFLNSYIRPREPV